MERFRKVENDTASERKYHCKNDRVVFADQAKYDRNGFLWCFITAGNKKLWLDREDKPITPICEAILNSIYQSQLNQLKEELL